MDESEGSKDAEVTGNECKFFTLGAIIVNDRSKGLFKAIYDSILKEHFPSDFPSDFKFHYEKLRDARSRNNEESLYKNLTWLRYIKFRAKSLVQLRKSIVGCYQLQ